MDHKEKANDLVDTFRIVLMNEDTDCGNEILCTLIAKQCALIAVDEIMKKHYDDWDNNSIYWQQVKTEIEKL